MSSADQPVSTPKAQRLYRQARLYSLVGVRQRAAQLCRSALSLGDHALARKLLARMELPGAEYFDVLRRMHGYLKPRNYVEIGVYKGKSLRLAAPGTRVLGIDPAPRLKRPAGAHMHSSRTGLSEALVNACGALAGTLMVWPARATMVSPRNVTWTSPSRTVNISSKSWRCGGGPPPAGTNMSTRQ